MKMILEKGEGDSIAIVKSRLLDQQEYFAARQLQTLGPNARSLRMHSIEKRTVNIMFKWVNDSE